MMSSIQDLIENITTDGGIAELNQLIHKYAISATFDVCLESHSLPTATVRLTDHWLQGTLLAVDAVISTSHL